MPRRLFIFEGLNGTGKTTLSRAFAGQHNAPIGRPFRNRDPDVHFLHDEGEEARNLRLLGVPVAAPAHDLYAADFVGKLRPSIVVFDRSLMTGIVYGNYAEEPMKGLREWAREYYFERLSEYKITLFYLHASFDTTKARVNAERPGRHPKKTEWTKLKKRYELEIQKFASRVDRVVKLNTDDLSAEEALAKANRYA